MNQLPVGDVFNRKYKLEERLGEGTSKQAWKATHLLMNRTTALKTLKEDTPLTEKILAEEATNHAKVGKHPHIVDIYDAGRDPETGLFFYAEEFIPGETLKKRIDRKDLSEPELITVITQIADALNHIHKQGVIYRDIKPDNIILQETSSNKKINIKLTDFGGSTKPGKKEIPYISADGTILLRAIDTFEKYSDPTVDMYSLGVMLYKLVTDHYPYEGNSLEEIKQKMQTTEPKKPSSYDHVQISSWLEKTIMSLLNKDPKKRPTAKQLQKSIWWHNHWKATAIISGITLASLPFLSLIGLFGTLHTARVLQPPREPQPSLTITYLNSKKIKRMELPDPCQQEPDTKIRIELRELFPDEIDNYTSWGNRIFAITKKDIFVYTIEQIEQKGTRYSTGQITKTPDQEETNIQVSTSGNLVAYMIGRNLHVIRADGEFERKVLEGIDEYTWYTFKDQITYQKEGIIYITDTQEAPLAEQNARKITEGTHPRWTDDGAYLFYLLKNEDGTSICAKECGYSDAITSTKKIPGWKFPVANSVRQFFVSRKTQVTAGEFGLAYFIPEKQQIAVIKQKLGRQSHAKLYPARDFQDIAQIVFNPDLNGIVFSGKKVQEPDYDLFHYNLDSARLIQLIDNQEDDLYPVILSRKSQD